MREETYKTLHMCDGKSGNQTLDPISQEVRGDYTTVPLYTTLVFLILYFFLIQPDYYNVSTQQMFSFFHQNEDIDKYENLPKQSFFQPFFATRENEPQEQVSQLKFKFFISLRNNASNFPQHYIALHTITFQINTLFITTSSVS